MVVSDVPVLEECVLDECEPLAPSISLSALLLFYPDAEDEKPLIIED